jgi:hypothetical protein
MESNHATIYNVQHGRALHRTGACRAKPALRGLYAKVNPRDRDVLKEWFAGCIEVDPNFCERELMPASAPWRGAPCAAFSVGKSYQQHVIPAPL